MTPTTFKTKLFNVLSIICACHLFFAGLELPNAYYEYLRILVTAVALLTVIKNLNKSRLYMIAFGVVAIIFNPVYPLDLYNKTFWLLLDIITALLFLVEAFDAKTVATPVEESKKRKRLFP
ncbi:DUF6804 family protein [Sediminicola sp. YIK13]|uniref:DUF6804 family protein n=1 Tax=Sediminicola sp. YIK13 TaxID=1453352 RepID=UPI0007814F25|nr:DUF6804 family protein [Sediminicola sp. YIK13]